jgi:hemerythrin-like domain-containing protein
VMAIARTIATEARVKCIPIYMPVNIGDTIHSFSDPTALLSDCHRRIEMFLGSLEKVASSIERPLTNDTRRALESALRYFREAAPKHTADEEQSVFPRLRQSGDPQVKSALGTLAALEQEHRRTDSLHAQVDMLGTRCLEVGRLSQSRARQFREAVADLGAIYTEHIRIEDDLVFPLAARILSGTDKAIIAKEMSARRR